jgi:DNA-binding transcriptional regulator YiaG
MASIHETVEDLHSAGVMDKRTLREFNELCLTPVLSLSPEEIRALRLGLPHACYTMQPNNMSHSSELDQ